MKLFRFMESVAGALLSIGIGVGEIVGRLVMMFGQTATVLVSGPWRVADVLRQIETSGFQAVPLVAGAGVFVGIVGAFQHFDGAARFGARSIVSAPLVLGLTREIGPLVTALIVIGRNGVHITWDLAVMRKTFQIDAVKLMSVDPVRLLVVPRVLAMLVTLPMLTLFFEFSGVVAGCVTCLWHLGIDETSFMLAIHRSVGLSDVFHGLVKSVLFGVAISVVASAEGYNAARHDRGIGSAMGRSVVISILMVMAIDCVMTALMFGPVK